jgi:hypothetical protein
LRLRFRRSLSNLVFGYGLLMAHPLFENAESGEDLTQSRQYLCDEQKRNAKEYERPQRPPGRQAHARQHEEQYGGKQAKTVRHESTTSLS